MDLDDYLEIIENRTDDLINIDNAEEISEIC